jgi:hypothetical protein
MSCSKWLRRLWARVAQTRVKTEPTAIHNVVVAIYDIVVRGITRVRVTQIILLETAEQDVV